MLIKVGTMVLCHLIMPNQVNVETKKIDKVPGVVKEIIEGTEVVEVKGDESGRGYYAYERKKYWLIVEPKDKDNIFKISQDACRPVLSEAEHIEKAKSKIKKNKAPVKNNTEEAVPQSESTPQNNEEKEDLLKQLE